MYLLLLKKSKSYYLIDDIYMTVHHYETPTKLFEEKIATSDIKSFGYDKKDPFEWYVKTKHQEKIYLPIGLFSKKKIAKAVGVKLYADSKRRWIDSVKKEFARNKRDTILVVVTLCVTVGSFFLHFLFDGNKILIGTLMTIDMILMYVQVRVLLMEDDKCLDDKPLLKKMDKRIIAFGAIGLFWAFWFVVITVVYVLIFEESFHLNLLIFPCYLAPSCVLIAALTPVILELLEALA